MPLTSSSHLSSPSSVTRTITKTIFLSLSSFSSYHSQSKNLQQFSFMAEEDSVLESPHCLKYKLKSSLFSCCFSHHRVKPRIVRSKSESQSQSQSQHRRCKRRAMENVKLCEVHQLQHRQKKVKVPESLKLQRNMKTKKKQNDS